jgi:hypothetical protein
MDHDRKLELFTKRLIDAYVRLRHKLKPSYTKMTKPNYMLWNRAAEELILRGIDPCQYVQWVFDVVMCYRPDVYDKEVTSIKFIHAYEREMPEIEDRVELEVELQAKKIKTLLNTGEKLESILKNELYELSPVVRFATAWSEGLKELADQLRPAAEEMLMFRPFYAKALKDWLPKEMTNVIHPTD